MSRTLEIGDRVKPLAETLEKYPQYLTKGKIYTIVARSDFFATDRCIIYADDSEKYWSEPDTAFYKISSVNVVGGELLCQ